MGPTPPGTGVIQLARSLAERLDTPEVRLVRGRPVTEAEVVRIALEQLKSTLDRA